MRPSEWYLKNIEMKRNIKIPSIVFKNEILKEFDRVIESKRPYLISKFYKNWKKYIDPKVIEFLNEELKKPRGRLSEEDIKLIGALTQNNNDPESFFDIIGNAFYISEVVDEMNRTKLSNTLEISLFLWLYLNIVEVVAKIISEYIRILIKKSKKEKEYEKFLKKFERGTHPEIGSTLKTIEKLGILTNDEIEKTVFKKNNLIRRKIAHANIYYDQTLNKLFLTNGETYELNEFKEEFFSLYEFLLEMIFYFNKRRYDLMKSLDSVFQELSRYFHWLERSHLRREFQKIVFGWEK